MICPPTSVYGGLLCMMIISVTSGTMYIQSGSDITDCNMKCPEDKDSVELYRQCGGEDKTLLENLCFMNDTKSHDPRLHLDTESGCWKLTHARKSDSCVYKIWCHCATRHLMSSTEIRVLGLLYMTIVSVSSGTVYIQSGSDITDCNMKCPQDDVIVELFRDCGGEEKTLLENLCYYNHTKSHDPRLQLHTGSGCWKLTPARKDDSCVYNVWCYDIPEYLISSTEIRVLDPVLISNITSNCSRLGEETAVSVQFSGEESAVTWEVDGEPLPERYRLIDDNRTLIIPGVQRDDAERRFRVRITNPVSEEIREYRLEIRDLPSDYRRSRMILIVPGALSVIIVALIYRKKRQVKSNCVYEDVSLSEVRSVPPIQNGSIPTNSVYEDVPLVGDRSVPSIQNGSMSTNGVYEDVPLAEDAFMPRLENGSITTNRVFKKVPLVEDRSVPSIQNGSIPTKCIYKEVPQAKDGSVPPIQNGFTPTNVVPQDVPLVENRSVPPVTVRG